MKTCSKCKKEQPETNFSKDSHNPDGLQYACKDCNSAYAELHRESIRERKRAYKQAHGEHFKIYNAAYCKAHREANLEHSKKYYAQNKEAACQRHKAWLKNHPEAKRVRNQTRRARKAGLASTLTPKQWTHILTTFNNTCAYCGAGDKKLHQEHFVPVLSGGEYGINNIIPACGLCNCSKGTKDFFTWYPKYDFYNKVRERKILRYLNYSDSVQQLSIL